MRISKEARCHDSPAHEPLLVGAKSRNFVVRYMVTMTMGCIEFKCVGKKRDICFEIQKSFLSELFEINYK
jgi:hypothetical protein